MRLCEYIDRVGERINDILVFVDTPLFTTLEVESVTTQQLADSLSQFLSVQHVISCFSSMPDAGRILDQRLVDETPAPVLKDIYELLDGKWQAMRRHVPLFEEIKKEGIYSVDAERDTQVQAQCDEYDTVRRHFMEHEFLDTLKKLEQKYGKTNIYGIPLVGEVVKHLIPSNPERRDRIEQHAVKVLGHEKIFQTFMRDGDDVNRVNNLREPPTNPSYTLAVHEKLYGNAEEYVINALERFDTERMRRYKTSFLKELEKRNMQL